MEGMRYSTSQIVGNDGKDKGYEPWANVNCRRLSPTDAVVGCPVLESMTERPMMEGVFGLCVCIIIKL